MSAGYRAAQLERAHVVVPAEIPPDVVTMNAEVALRDLDGNQEMVFSVVFPAKANADQRRISVLAPPGTAVLGYRPGGYDRLERQDHDPKLAQRSARAKMAVRQGFEPWVQLLGRTTV